MILTVTANAALDRTVEVPSLRLGTRHRIGPERAQAGGKGINVARVLDALGRPVTALAVLGGETGAWIEADLARAGLARLRVDAPGQSRVCLELVEADGRATQLHGPGVRADESIALAVERAVMQRLEGARWLALCGSLPPGMPTDLYARLIRLARARRVATALDASGAALRAGWDAGPDLVRINRSEADGVRGVAAPGHADPTRGSAGLTVISDGADAIEATTREGSRWHIRPPTVRVRNAIGCGDAMMAGLLDALDRGEPVDAALRAATALAAAEAESPVAGRPETARAAALAGAVEIRVAP